MRRAARRGFECMSSATAQTRPIRWWACPDSCGLWRPVARRGGHGRLGAYSCFTLFHGIARKLGVAWLSAHPRGRAPGYLAWRIMRIAAWKPRETIRDPARRWTTRNRGEVKLRRNQCPRPQPAPAPHLQLMGGARSGHTHRRRLPGRVTSGAPRGRGDALALIARAVPVSHSLTSTASPPPRGRPRQSSVSPQTRPGADLSREPASAAVVLAARPPWGR